MSGGRVVRKIPVALLGFLLCLGALLVSGLFSARAFEPKKGEIGGCTWEYKDNGNGDVTFRLYPTNGVEGTASWSGAYPDYDNTEKYQSYYTKVTRVIIDKPVKLTSAAGMFWSFEKVRAMDLSGLITDDVTSFEQMFKNCQSLTYLNLSGLKTNKATNMKNMFLDCTALKEVDVSGWDMSNVTSLEDMFQNCKKLEKIKGMETWTWNSGTKLQNLEGMFDHCSELREVNVSSLRTDNVTTMRWMFAHCHNLPFLDVGNWNVGKVEDLQETFYRCWKLEELRDINGWNIKSVKTLKKTFIQCRSLKELNLNNWDVSQCTTFEATFCHCHSLVRLEVGRWNVSNASSFYSTFQSCSSLQELDVRNWVISKATTLEWCFTMTDDDGRCSLRYLDISGKGWDSSNVSVEGMYYFIGSDRLAVLKASNQMNLDKNYHDGDVRETFARKYMGSSEYTGSKSGTAWQQVGGGTIDKPAGKKFGNDVVALGKFNDKSGYDNGYRVETYVRTSPSQYFLFDKNSPDAEGHMDPQIIDQGAKGKINASAFSYPGHHVVKWNTKKDGTGTPYNIDQEYTNDKPGDKTPIVLYAQWGTNKYDIAFDCNAPQGVTPGSATMPPKTGVLYGDKITLPKNEFIVPDHDFAGWALNKEGTGTLYTDKQEVSNLSNENGKTVTLYAQWFKRGQKYTIKFEANKPADAGSVGGQMPDQEVTYGQDTTLTRNKFTCAGYGFVGWSKLANATEKDPIVDGALIKDVLTRPKPTTITLYAQWNKNRSGCNIVFDANAPKDATPTGSMRHMMLWEGEEKELPANGFSCSNYKFLCWTTDKEGLKGNCYQDKQKISTVALNPSQPEVTLYAQWIRPNQSYVITFDGNDPSGGKLKGTMEDKPVRYGEDVVLPGSGFTCDGYDFIGWSRRRDFIEGDEFFSDGATVKSLIVRPPQEKITLYGQWVKHGQPYTIAFDKNDAAATGTMNPLPAKCGEPIELTANNFSRPKHAFLCWSTEKTESPTAQYFQDREKVSLRLTHPLQKTVTLYALWIKIGQEYNVIFDANYPSGVAAADTHGTMSPEPMKYDTEKKLDKNQYACKGYTFVGWSRKKVPAKGDFFKDEAIVKNLVITPPVDSVTLYAQWKQQNNENVKYTISFDVNAPQGVEANLIGGEMQAVKVMYGQETTLPKNEFTVKGYTFGGWSTDKDQTKGKSFKDEELVIDLAKGLPKGEITLYALWKQQNNENVKYTISFDVNAPEGVEANLIGGEMQAVKVMYGQETTLPKNEFTVKGYTFGGWSTDKDQTKGKSFKDEELVIDLAKGLPKGEITLYALWKQQNNENVKYTISFDVNAPEGVEANLIGGEMQAVKVMYGQETTLPKNEFTVKGYTFGGWSTDKDQTKGKSFKDEELVIDLAKGLPKGEITLYALWKQQNNENVKYTISFDVNAPEGVEANLIGGEMQAVKVMYGQETTLPKNEFTVKGYTFGGWSTDKDQTKGKSFKDEELVIDLAKGLPEGEITLYALWKQQNNENVKYTISFDINAPEGVEANLIGGEMQAVKVMYGQETTLPKNEFTVKGYTFGGWSTDKDQTKGKSFKDEELVIDLAKGLPKGEITLYALWKQQNNENVKYTISFDVNAPEGVEANLIGGEMQAVKVMYGQETTLPKNEFTVKGYTFGGWSTDKDQTKGKSFKDEELVIDLAKGLPKGEITLYALWKQQNNENVKYTISFDVNAPEGVEANLIGGEMQAVKVMYGQETTLPKNEFTVKGYTFGGWSTDKDQTKGKSFKDEELVIDLAKGLPKGEITLYALWKQQNNENVKYTISFDVNAPEGVEANLIGGEMQAVKVMYGQETTLPKNEFTVKGYTFGGWSTDKDQTKGKSFKDEELVIDLAKGLPKGEITLYALWKQQNNENVKYTISFDVNAPEGVEANLIGGEMQAVKVMYGQETTLPKNEFTVKGYTFGGWSTDKDQTKGKSFKDEELVIDLAKGLPKGEITLYALWKQQNNENVKYTISFDVNAPEGVEANLIGGEMQAVKVMYGQETTLPKNEFTVKGYTFGGWSTDKDQTKGKSFKDEELVIDLAKGLPKGEITLYALWKQQNNENVKYTISFDVNAPEGVEANLIGGEMQAVKVMYGQETTLPKNEFTVKGYTFGGWSTDKDQTKGKSFKDEELVIDLAKGLPKGEITLYALWKQQNNENVKYTISFDVNAPEGVEANLIGGEMQAVKVMYGQETTLPKNEFTVKGYTFGGWSTDKDQTKGKSFKDEELVIDLAKGLPKGEITLYALWKQHNNENVKYTISFDVNAPEGVEANLIGGEMQAVKVMYGQETTLPKNEFTVKGYTFGGWSTDKDQTKGKSFKDEELVIDLAKGLPKGEITLYALWKQQNNENVKYTISFDVNAPEGVEANLIGGEMQAVKVMYGQETTLPKNEFTVKGYTFGGWSTDKDQTKGKSFKDEELVIDLAKGLPKGEITLYALWKQHNNENVKYTISFDVNAPEGVEANLIGGEMQAVKVMYGQETTLPKNEFTVKGYTFGGWSTDKDQTKGKSFKDEELVIDLAKGLPKGEITLYALWKQQNNENVKYTISFDVNAPEGVEANLIGGEMQAVKVMYGQETTLPKNEFTVKGYTFGGWSTDKDQTKGKSFKDEELVIDLAKGLPKGEITLYALWKQQNNENVKYTISFDVNAPEGVEANLIGGEMQAVKVMYGQETTLPKNEFTVKGYTFGGWSTDKDQTKGKSFKDEELVIDLAKGLPKGEITLYALWKQQNNENVKYTISFDVNAPEGVEANLIGGEMQAVKVMYGQETTLPKNEFTVKGYTFGGWSTDKDQTKGKSFKDEELVIDLAKGLPKGEITLYALWKQQNNENVKYTISFDVNAPEGVEANLIGGEMQAVKVMYGQETTLPKNEFTVKGYTFGGWSTDKDQTKGKSFKDEELVIDLAKGLPKGEITLYALWKQQNNENVKYTISFDVNAPEGVEANLIGGEMQAVKVMYGQETTLPKNEFTVKGYTFGGWSTDKDQTKGKSFKDEELVIDLAKGLPKGEITLYALWKQQNNENVKYTISFDVNAPEGVEANLIGGEMQAVKVMYGQETTLPKNEFTVKGYTFGGWSTDKDQTKGKSFKDEELVIDLAKGLPKGEITLYALWKQQNNENVKYTISFDVNAPEGVEANLIGGEMQAVKVMYGQETTLPKNEFTVKGYTFGGWSTDKDQTKGKSFKDEELVIDLAKGLPKGEITLYALWKQQNNENVKYTISFDVNAPEGVEANLIGGEMQAVKVMYGQETTLPKNEFTVKGYTFGGWSTDKDQTKGKSFKDEELVIDLAKGLPKGEITLYALWKQQNNENVKYTISFDVNAPEGVEANLIGGEMQAVKVMYGQETTLPKNEFTVKGYTFGGWSTDKDQTKGKSFKDEELVIDLAKGLPKGEITLYALWKQQNNENVKYTISFDVNAPEGVEANLIGGEMQAVKVMYGQETTLPKNEFTVKGYTFGGWSTDKDQTKGKSFKDEELVIDLAKGLPKGEITLYALWKQQNNENVKYTISFDVNAPEGVEANLIGGEMQAVKVMYGQETTLPKNEFTVKGYTFGGWSTDKDQTKGKSFKDEELVIDLAKGLPKGEITLYALWKQQNNENVKYTISFDVNAPEGVEANLIGGEMQAVKVMYGQETTLPKNEFTVKGYTFGGWSTDKDQTKGKSFKDEELVIDLAKGLPKGEITLYALWKQQNNENVKYTISFDVNAPEGVEANLIGGEMQAVKVMYGQETTLPKNEFTVKGYTFGGWSTDKDQTKGKSFKDEELVIDLAKGLPKGEITLYALWKQQNNENVKYTISFDVNAPEGVEANLIGGEMQAVKVMYGQETTLPKNEFTVKGYTFGGWSTDKDQTKGKSFKDEELVIDLAKGLPKGEITLYALWKQQNNENVKYTISFDVNAPEGVEANLIGGEMQAVKVMYGQETTLPKNEFTVKGYTFGGWSTDKDQTKGKSFKDEELVIDLAKGLPKGEITLYALWKQQNNENVKYTISFDVNAPEGVEANLIGGEMQAVKVMYGQETTLPKNEFTVKGYTFGGWSTDKDQTKGKSFKDEELVIDLAKGLPKGEITLYALWKQQNNENVKYTISFDVNAPEGVEANLIGGEMQAVKVMYGQETTLPKNEFTVKGYTFGGWSTDKDQTKGKSFKDEELVIDLAKGLPKGEITLYALWKQQNNENVKYTISFDVNAPEGVEANLIGGEMQAVKVMYGQETTLPKNEFTVKGYTFGGWSTDKDQTKGKSFKDEELVIDLAKGLPKGEITLYALWKQQNNENVKYTISFDVNAPEGVEANLIGGEMQAVKVMYGQETTLPKNEFTVKGYTFGGWSTDKDQTKGKSFKDEELVIDLAKGLPKGEITLYALWKQQNNENVKYTISFDVNAPEGVEANLIGGEMQAVKVMYGQETTLPKNEFTVKGYTFGGWSTDKDQTKGKSFKDEELVIDLAKGLPKGEITLYALWKQQNNENVKYTISFDVNAPEGVEANLIGGEMQAVKVMYGQETTLPKNEFTVKGYTFGGWSTDKDQTKGKSFKDEELVIDLAKGLPKGEITLYALWKQQNNENVKYTISFDVNAPEGVEANLIGGEMQAVKVMYGQETTLPKNEFTVKGYTFGGWSTDKDQTKGKSFKDEELVIDLAKGLPKGEITLYALWKQQNNENVKYTISFDVNAPEGVEANLIGGEMQAVKVMYGQETTLPKNEFTVKGYTFGGWSTDKDQTKGKSFKDEELVIDLAKGLPKGEITLYALWKQQNNENVKYTISFDVNAPEGVEANLIGGEMQAVKVMYGQETTLPKNEFTVKGYTFGGWSTDKDQTKGKSFKDEELVIDLAKGLPKGEITLYALWKQQNNENVKYTISFDVNAPEGVEANLIGGEMQAVKVMYGQETTLPKNMFTVTGYSFLGWSTTEGTAEAGEFFRDKAMIKDLAIGLPTNEVNLYARWGKHGETYTITFNKNAPEGVDLKNIEGTMDPQTMEYGDEAKPLSENQFKLTGYSFLGWSTREGTAEAGEFFRDKAMVKDLATGFPVKKVNLYARWGKHGDTYTINFHKNAPEGVDLKNIEGTMDSQTMEYGDEAKPLSENQFKLTGYSFLGWSTTEGTAETGAFFRDKAMVKDLATGHPIKQVNLYARWGEHTKTYTINFNKNAPEGVDPKNIEGTMSPQEMTYGEAKPLSENQFKLTGYSFLGWSTTEGTAETGAFFRDKAMVKDLATGHPIKQVNLYARWGKHGDTYTINFHKNAPEGVDPTIIQGEMTDQTMTYGKAEALNKNKFTFAGHLFLGWSTREGRPEEGELLKDKAMVKDLATGHPIKQVNLYAQWGEALRITYEATEGGSVSPTSEMLEEGVELRGSTATPDAGYHFVKWTSDKKPDWSSTKAVLGKEEIEAVAKKDGRFSNVTFTAHFEANALYTVTFDKNDIDAEGTMSDETFTCNVAKKLPACTFTKEGYKFSGWNTEADGSGTSFEDEAEMDFSTTTPITLYAQWKKVDQDSSSDRDDRGDRGGQDDRGDRGGGDDYEGWQRRNDNVSYRKNGAKLTGWQELNGTIQNPSSSKRDWFYFDSDGTMLTGRHKLVGGFPNKQGVQEAHWFGLDEQTGAQIRGWQKVGNGSSEKWYYYRPEDGAGLVGRHHIVGGFKNAQGVQEKNWFFFDINTGAEVRGWHEIVEDGHDNWYYYRDGDGIMLKGQHELVGGFDHRKNWFYFDEVTGIEVRGWKEIKYQNKWCYYRDGDGIMLKGQHELVGGFDQCKNWFYFDEETGGEIRGWKYIDYQDKWCYYRDGDGIMLKGQHELQGGDNGGMNWFYFDEVTGAELRNCWKDIPSQDKTCYYGSDGTMYKGWRRVNGDRYYYFSKVTGAVR